jgi:hypothetical protein
MYKYGLKYTNKKDFIKDVFSNDNIYNLKLLNKKFVCSCGNGTYYRVSLSNVICTKCFMLSTFDIYYLPSDNTWEQVRINKKPLINGLNNI